MLKRRPLPPQEVLRQLFSYDRKTGVLRWRKRPVNAFVDLRSAKNWNTKYAGRAAGTVCHDGLRLTLRGQLFAVHRIIFKIMTGLEPSHIDHEDLDNTNNRFANLRAADNCSNGWNTAGHMNTVSGVKNVYFHKNLKKRPWRATVNCLGKSYNSPYFATKEEAATAAKQLRNKLHGEFARHGGI